MTNNSYWSEILSNGEIIYKDKFSQTAKYTVYNEDYSYTMNMFISTDENTGETNLIHCYKNAITPKRIIEYEKRFESLGKCSWWEELAWIDNYEYYMFECTFQALIDNEKEICRLIFYLSRKLTIIE